MAQKVQVVLTCDLDDEEVAAAETVTFGFEGVNYAFELCPEHLEDFASTMQTYIDSARKTDGSRRGRSSQQSAPRQVRRASIDREQLQAMRGWARDNGYAISDRGRIPSEIRDAFEAAHNRNAKKR